jgi:hypothetical protein
MQTVIQTSRRMDSFLHETAQNFELLSNIQDQIKQIKKPIAVDVLFKAYPMVPLSCIDPIWSDGTFNNAQRASFYCIRKRTREFSTLGADPVTSPRLFCPR